MQIQVTVIIIILSFAATSCSNSSTEADHGVDPGTPQTGVDNFPINSLTDWFLFEDVPFSILVLFRTDEYGSIPDDYYLDSAGGVIFFGHEPESFELKHNGRVLDLEKYEDDNSYIFGKSFEQPIEYGESIRIEFTYDSKTFSQTLTMPYSPKLNVSESFYAGEASELTWSAQESPDLFLMFYIYGEYDENCMTSDKYDLTLKDGVERSHMINQELVSEFLNSDYWFIGLTGIEYGYWKNDGVLFLVNSEGKDDYLENHERCPTKTGQMDILNRFRSNLSAPFKIQSH